MFPLDDTIVAVASPPGGAARGIVRLSGPRAIEIVAKLVGWAERSESHQDNSRQIVTGSLRLRGLHSPLPCDLYLWDTHGSAEPSPAARVRSYTGQPVAEIHTLGSQPLLELLVRSLCEAGARLAEPGEFTLRAFLAGRIDLTQAEAVLGVIDAMDRRDLNVALAQLAGGLARPLHHLRESLLDLLAEVEAGFDFADEEIAFVTLDELERRLTEAEAQVAAVVEQMSSRGETNHAAKVVLTGRPNTGKSSLFNALVGRQTAIVSEHPGTTRDYLTAELDLDGVKCQLNDTAGRRGEKWGVGSGEWEVDVAAQSLGRQRRRAADVELLCLDSTRPLDQWECGELQTEANRCRVIALTKCDMPRGVNYDLAAIETSSRLGLGIKELRQQLRSELLASRSGSGEAVAATSVRCRQSLELAARCLQEAREAARGKQEELAAAELRLALDQLGAVVGAIYTDDVLERIFSRFCVGK